MNETNQSSVAWDCTSPARLSTTTPPTLALRAPILLELRHVHDTVFGFGIMFEAYDGYTRIMLDYGVTGVIGREKFRLGLVYRLSSNIA